MNVRTGLRQGAVDPFLGSTELYAFDFAPQGWDRTDGQLLPINQNPSLFSLLGTRYGGDGWTIFALPKAEALDGGNGGKVYYNIAWDGNFPSRS